MLKVLIKESDLMFRQGIEYFLSDFFWRRFSQEVAFITGYTSENIADADVIVLSMCNGERYTCFPELRDRRKGIIIGLVDERDPRRSPNCFEDIVYITRRGPLEEVTNKLYVAWHKWLSSNVFPQYKSCLGCKHHTLSLQQQEIMAGFYYGNTVKEVANVLNINYKTAAAHKYIVMRKFSLKNDYELFRFLGMLREKNETRLFL
ncbi:helix-turn-helix transcriptional regulator [Leclercia adecarboxylata]|uniref:helix-turn-helix transcriptional regulator n=1 Tax=Leclercia adecarboxylata TaxID=83655 RepID=UPI00057B4F2E|nr:LuxR C-terminal-related transcriptional regulator [Leclercia adecarboxylata]